MKRLLPVLAPVVVAVGLLLVGWAWLRGYTRHNELMRVPDLAGANLAEAEALLAKRDLSALVIDSVFVEDRPKGTVVEQDPDAGKEVKAGRKVYLVLNANQPKMIDMPKLVDLSKRQALSVLDILGLKVKEMQYKPDPCVDCVIAQLYKGKPIAADERIRRGEAITLVLGAGEKGERVPVPDLSGLSMADVQLVLNMASLNLGVLVECQGCNTQADSTLARVRRQSPAAGANNRIALGSTIDLWLTSDTTGLRPAEGWNDPSRYTSPDSLHEP
ncbi:MAG: PASTA domain-containing protein [Flavobacteriales bacterium]|nr:PASTA domain-containing protein [Flavobacteriales bacterium]